MNDYILLEDHCWELLMENVDQQERAGFEVVNFFATGRSDYLIWCCVMKIAKYETKT